jgi:hypothetical protein
VAGVVGLADPAALSPAQLAQLVERLAAAASAARVAGLSLLTRDLEG